MVRRIELVLPTEYEEAWERLKSLYGLDDSELLMKLIETELQTMKTREHIQAYEKVEKAMREIEEVAGIDGLRNFSFLLLTFFKLKITLYYFDHV